MRHGGWWHAYFNVNSAGKDTRTARCTLHDQEIENEWSINTTCRHSTTRETLDTCGTMTKVQHNDDITSLEKHPMKKASDFCMLKLGYSTRYEYELVCFEMRCAGSIIYSRGSGLLSAVPINNVDSLVSAVSTLLKSSRTKKSHQIA
jgi:hypothetical protein